LPDVSRLEQLARDDRPIGKQLLAGVARVKGGDRAEILFGEDARIGERGFLLEVGAARHERERLFVDRLDDDLLKIRVLLIVLLLYGGGGLRQVFVEVVGGMDCRHRRTGSLQVRCGNIILRHCRRGDREESEGHCSRNGATDAALQNHDYKNSSFCGARLSVSMPSGLARTAAEAMPRKRPCSTTPGISWSAPESALGSGMRPNDASRMKCPPSVMK